MKTIGIKNDVRDELKQFQNENESVVDALNRLFDLVEEDMNKDFKFGVGQTNIGVDEVTMKRIKSYQVTPRESYGRIIARALKIAKTKE